MFGVVLRSAAGRNENDEYIRVVEHRVAPAAGLVANVNPDSPPAEAPCTGQDTV
jgi:hypothetical protein